MAKRQVAVLFLFTLSLSPSFFFAIHPSLSFLLCVCVCVCACECARAAFCEWQFSDVRRVLRPRSFGLPPFPMDGGVSTLICFALLFFLCWTNRGMVFCFISLSWDESGKRGPMRGARCSSLLKDDVGVGGGGGATNRWLSSLFSEH